MATDSHNRYCRGFERGQSRRVREDAKEKGMRKKLTNEEYWKEIAEISKQLYELERMIEENQRVGWLMKKKVKWQRPQRKKEKMTNAQLKEEILRMLEYLEKNLETEASSGTKGSKSLTSDIFCMFARITCGREQPANVVTEKENGTTDVLKMSMHNWRKVLLSNILEAEEI